MVCSRSVANRAYLTNQRPKKRKVIITRRGSGVRVPNSPPSSSYSNPRGFGCVFCLSEDLPAQQSGKQAKAGHRARHIL